MFVLETGSVSETTNMIMHLERLSHKTDLSESGDVVHGIAQSGVEVHRQTSTKGGNQWSESCQCQYDPEIAAKICNGLWKGETRAKKWRNNQPRG